MTISGKAAFVLSLMAITLGTSAVVTIGAPPLLAWVDNHRSAGNVAKWISAQVGLSALGIAFFSTRSAWRQWKTQYVVTQWDKTLDFLFEHPEYLDEKQNQNYSWSRL